MSVSKTHHTPNTMMNYFLEYMYIYQVTHTTSGSFGMNFQIEPHFFLTFIVACGQEDNGASN